MSLTSLFNRKVTAILMLVSIALSLALWLAIERIRIDTKSSFSRTLTSANLIVGSKTGSLNLLLYSVFRMGAPTNNISWIDVSDIEANKSVKWLVPISLGDSHKSFSVVGTDERYLKHYQYGNEKPLVLAQGQWFVDYEQVVIGAQVAKALGYQIGDKVQLSHGTGEVSFSLHPHLNFEIVGILGPTGTPVDKTLHVDLKAITALHLSEEELTPNVDLTPKSITAAYVGLKSNLQTFKYQRSINETDQLMAIIPGVALQELWQLLSIAENSLWIMSFIVLLVGFIGLLALLLSNLDQRKREMALLRSQGMTSLFLSWLMLLEVLLLLLFALVLGVASYGLILMSSSSILQQSFGLSINIFSWPTSFNWVILSYFGIAMCTACIPSLITYKQSLHMGLTQRN